eukprot:scaffold5037_cov114-Isochrysis_galbana.AAC.1
MIHGIPRQRYTSTGRGGRRRGGTPIPHMGKTARLHLSTRSTPEAVQYGPCPRIRLAPELQPLGREGRLAGRMRRPDIGIGEAHKKGPVLSAQRADREARRAGTQKLSPVAGALQELQGATERCL